MDLVDLAERVEHLFRKRLVEEQWALRSRKPTRKVAGGAAAATSETVATSAAVAAVAAGGAVEAAEAGEAGEAVCSRRSW